MNEEVGSVWNYHFQTSLESKDESKKNIYLKELSDDFIRTASDFARIIINEFDQSIYSHSDAEDANDESLNLEIQRRLHLLTIKPDLSIGGSAGGVKFKHGGILFKFALDWVRFCCPFPTSFSKLMWLSHFLAGHLQATRW